MEQQEIKWEKHETNTDFIKLDFGEEVTGTYVNKEQSEKYPNQFVYLIDLGKEKGVKKISGTVISNHFENLKFGTLVKIIYKGKVKNYHDYEVYVGCKK